MGHLRHLCPLDGLFRRVEKPFQCLVLDGGVRRQDQGAVLAQAPQRLRSTGFTGTGLIRRVRISGPVHRPAQRRAVPDCLDIAQELTYGRQTCFCRKFESATLARRQTWGSVNHTVNPVAG